MGSATQEVETQLEEWQAERLAKEEEKERRRESTLAGDGDDDAMLEGKKEGSSKKKVKIDDAPQKMVWEEKGGLQVACMEVVEALLGMDEAWPFEVCSVNSVPSWGKDRELAIFSLPCLH